MAAKVPAALMDELRRVPLFAHLPDDQLEWIAERGTEVRLAAGGRIASQGDPADGFYVVLEGETEWTRTVGTQEVHAVTLGPGTMFAELILLTDAPYPTSGRALSAVRLLKLEPDAFWQMLTVCPTVLRGIVRTAAERSQIHESVTQQQAKLISLGSMAAGLAHELNNPAAAVSRSAEGLGDAFGELSPRAFGLGARLDAEQREWVGALPRGVAERARAAAELDALARSDQEDEVGTWLDERGVEDGWELGPTLVGVGLDTAWLDELTEHVPAEMLGDVLGWLQAEVNGRALVDEIRQGSTRISKLVKAIKEYSYMDRAAEQEVDLHEGLESTLTILGHKLKKGVEIVREYDRGPPPITARGGELNQVWTNLIDNAVDAMGGGGRLWVRTRCEAGRVVVEIKDDGPGIPPEVLPRIWEPFFTTKGVGKGTGLGLDIARRIVVENHGGDIRVTSEPGDTRFEVRLPIGGSEQE